MNKSKHIWSLVLILSTVALIGYSLLGVNYMKYSNRGFGGMMGYYQSNNTNYQNYNGFGGMMEGFGGSNRNYGGYRGMMNGSGPYRGMMGGYGF